MEAPVKEQLPNAYQNLLPTGADIPIKLPKNIGDPFLLAAWIYLYNRMDEIPVQNGTVISGRGLAAHVLEHDIEILWSSEDICRGNSCSQQSVCPDAACLANYKRKVYMPVYLSPRYREYTSEMLVKLADSLSN